jgi:oxalate---CoA ligase
VTQERILSVAGILEEQARIRPESPALLSVDGVCLSYAATWRRVTSLAAVLHSYGVGAGGRVAIVLPNGPDMALAFLGVAAVASAAPLNPAYRESEFEFYLGDLKAQALIAPGGDHPARNAARGLGIRIVELADSVSDTADFPKPAPANEALVLHTSGTTSRPKLVPLSNANLCHSAAHIQQTLSLTPEDRCLNVMPLFHIHGLAAALLSTFAAGGSVVATPGFDAARFFDWIEMFRPTWYTAVPTIHQAVLSTGRAAPGTSLRFVRSSSSALAPAVMAGIEEAFRVPMIEAYGMTEAAHQMASNPLPPRPRKPGSVGLAAGPRVSTMDAAGRLLKPGQTGEVVIQGLNVTSGYENNPAANAECFTNGWFRTGDQGYLDEDGYLFLTGRLKEIINRGGEKIAPREIDERLLEHPGVAQAIAFAVPHTSLGQDIAAAVILREGAAVSAAELRKFATAQLAAFKVPARILIVDEIPKGPTGKPQRIGLAERLGLFTSGPQAVAAAADYVAPRTPVEELLAQIWAEVLRVERVGIHDEFSQLGGDSLMAATLITRVAAVIEVDPDSLAGDEISTVAEMAGRVAACAR